MIDAGSLEFAHARLWSRWGARADESLWHRIETTRGLGPVLDLARGGALARWVEGLGPQPDVHAIESHLRRRWHACVDEVAAWMPAAWHAAVRACAALIDLPLRQHLARGGAPPAWLTTARAADAVSARDTDRPFDAWLAQWRGLAPATAGREAVERQLLPLLQGQLEAFADPATHDGWALRRALQARLAALLRRSIAEPVAAFAFLALCALDAERLRGELVRRAAFGARREAA